MNPLKGMLDKINVESVELELMRTAYGSTTTLLSRLDPRILMVWYLIFAFAPWFFFDTAKLLSIFAFVTVITAISKANKLVLFLLCLGIIGQMACYAIVAYFLGGNMAALAALLTLTLKLATISLASIAVFSNIDPERFSDALLSFGAPAQLAFSISYGYRIIPVMVEEYKDIMLSFRLRGHAPSKKGFLSWRYAYYLLKIAVLAFYPLILNTAKRIRTTIEALETKGFSYAMNNNDVKRLKLSYLKIKAADIIFLLVSILVLIAIILI